MFWWVGVGPLDLNETLRAYRLVAASSFVEVRRIIKKANRAFRSIFVEKRFHRLPVD
jgi:hypothetical protein